MLIGRLIGGLISGLVFAAFPSSSHYQLQSWSINSGGTNSSASSTYKARATTGEVSSVSTVGPTYKIFSSAIGTAQASTPPAPTVDNGSGTYYNKLHFVINNSANPSDATFAVAISTTVSGTTCTNPSYVQANGTSSATIVWQSYASWGGASGTYATGLSINTNYYFCVAAQAGQFSASAFGPDGTATTATPSLTFALQQTSVNLGNLSAGSITTSPAIGLFYSSNSANGGFIYMAGSTTGLFSATANHNIQITPPSQDISATEGSGAQATGDASMVAQSPYNSSGNTVGAFYTTFQPLFIATGPVSVSQPSVSVKAYITSTTPAAADYTNTLTFVAAPSF